MHTPKSKPPKKSSRTKQKSKKKKEKKPSSTKQSVGGSKRKTGRQRVEPQDSLTGSKTRPKTPASGRDVAKRGAMKMEKNDGRGKKENQGKSKGSQALHSGPPAAQSTPQKVDYRHKEMDLAHVERVVKRYTKEKREKSQCLPKTSHPISEKSSILIDRVNKAPMKPEKSEMFMEEMSSFHRKAKTDKKKKEKKKAPQEGSGFLDDEDCHMKFKRRLTYEQNSRNLFNEEGVPFWALTLEPTEQDMIGVEEPVTVGAEHIELFHREPLKLRTVPPQKLTLDELQPMRLLRKRDDTFFDFCLIFSNTYRSLVHLCPTDEQKKKNREHAGAKIEKSGERTIRFVPHATTTYYSRSNPIASMREAVAASAVLAPPTGTITTTTTTTTTTSTKTNSRENH